MTKARAVAVGLAFLLASLFPSGLSAGNSNGWSWTAVASGWLIQTPTGGLVYFPDKSHTWDGTGNIEPISATSVRLKIPSGWIVANVADATYVPDSKHTWPAPVIVQVPVPPTPSPSPEPTVSPIPPTPSPTTSASPSPTPTPVTSEPTAFTKPTTLENMSEVSPGVYRSTNLSTSNVAVVQIRLPNPVPRGGRLRVSYVASSNAPFNSAPNIKWGLRNWLNEIGNANPNDYMGTQKTGQPVFCTEQVPSQISWKAGVAWTRKYLSDFIFTPTPTQHVWEYRYNTAPGKGDGAVTFKAGGAVWSSDNWISDSVSKPGTRDIVCIQVVNTGSTLPAGVWFQVSDIKVEVLP